jgi:chemotaxis methyl-accepting protein methylase
MVFMHPDLVAILAEIKALRGIDFSLYRQGTLGRRIANRMAALGISDLQEYRRHLLDDAMEPDLLVEAIGIQVSHFFRDPYVFEYLAKYVLPAIIERKRANNREIRFWSAGCSTGEEAYTLAILLDLALRKETDCWLSYIFASDINGLALRFAADAIYPREKLLETKMGLIDTYFQVEAEGFRVRPFLRERVQFCHDDLVSTRTVAPAESIFGDFDLVLCRNVLIYFEPQLQEQVLQKLFRSLGASGFLVLGPSEMLPVQVAGQFRDFEPGCRIWQKRE